MYINHCTHHDDAKTKNYLTIRPDSLLSVGKALAQQSSDPKFHPIDDGCKHLSLLEIINMTDDIIFDKDAFEPTPIYPPSLPATTQNTGSVFQENSTYKAIDTQPSIPQRQTQEFLSCQAQPFPAGNQVFFGHKTIACPGPQQSVSSAAMPAVRIAPTSAASTATFAVPIEQSSQKQKISKFGWEEIYKNRPGRWFKKFVELCHFKKETGHCLVPHGYSKNPPLARWVKRQRYQFKLRKEGKQSTISQERVILLEKIGFVWDSQASTWDNRFNELREFRRICSHCNVPSNFPANPQLATWVKCQRRQRKLLMQGKLSNISRERIAELESLGFEWELRTSKNSL